MSDSPVLSTSPLLEGSFDINNNQYSMCLMSDCLMWKMKDTASDEQKIPISEILSVCIQDAQSVDGLHGLIISYVVHKADHKLGKGSISCTGKPELCLMWRERLQRLIDALPLRPRRMLVLVNPVSGWSRGAQIYHKDVEPLFQEANILLDVIVTKKAHHTEEIINDYDLASIDSIVILGGDGMYHELVNGYLRRLTREAGTDINDPDAELPVLTVPIGVIPCGTGNVMAEGCHGNKDVTTAVLSIIVGGRTDCNVFAVFSQAQLVSYAALNVAYGVWSDLVQIVENRRWLGVLRYPITMFQLIFKSRRCMDMAVEVRSVAQWASQRRNKPAQSVATSAETKTPDKANDKADFSGESNQMDKHSTQSLEWHRLERGFIGLITFLGDMWFKQVDEGQQFHGMTRLVMNNPSGRLQFVKMLAGLMKKDTHLANSEAVDHNLVEQFKVKLSQPSDPSSYNGKMERIVNIDGEIFQLKEPQFHVRLYTGTLKLFCSVPTPWWMPEQ